SDAASESAHCFHLLGLAELLLQCAALGHVFSKQLEQNVIIFITEGTPGKAHVDMSVVVPHPVGGQSLEFFQGAKVVRQTEPLLEIGIQVRQIAAYQLRRGGVSQHTDEGWVYIEKNAGRVAAAE